MEWSTSATKLSASICENAVSAPCPISVSPHCIVTVPSRFSSMRFDEVSSAIGQTAVLYQNEAQPMPLRIEPLSFANSRTFRS